MSAQAERATLTLPEPRLALVLAAKAGPGAARDDLIAVYAPLIAHAARRYRNAPNVDPGDLRQEGVVGLLRALERFDPTQGTPFWAYATWWVRQAMQQLVGELGRPVVLSDRAARHLAHVRQSQLRLARLHGREPTASELEGETGLARQHIDRLVAAARPPRGLHEPLSGDGHAGTVGELIVDPLGEEPYERVQRHAEAHDLPLLLEVLNPRERAVVGARFGLDEPERTRAELAATLGMSSERIRQIENRALHKLRAASKTHGREPGQRRPA